MPPQPGVRSDRRTLCPADSRQAFQFLDHGTGVLGGIAGILYRIHFGFQEVRSLEYHIEQGFSAQAQTGGVLPEDIEYIFHRVGQRGDTAQIHHGCRALDGMHDPEYLIDAVRTEALGFFRVQKDLVKLIQQSGGFIDKSV